MNERDLKPFISGNLTESLSRLDLLLAGADDLEKIKIGMGMRLALGMAKEIQEKRDLGSETGEKVASWTEKYGQEAVDAAIAVAREFLTKPEELRKTLAERLRASDADIGAELDSEEPADPAVEPEK